MLMTFQLLSILVSRIKHGNTFNKNTSKVPLSYGDTSQVILIQRKESIAITSSLLLITLTLTLIILNKKPPLTGSMGNIIGLTSLSIMLILLLIILFAHQHCFCILTKTALYVNTVPTRFKTTIIPINNIVKCEHRQLRSSNNVIVITQNKRYEIPNVANWQELIDSIDKLKSRQDSKQTA